MVSPIFLCLKLIYPCFHIAANSKWVSAVGSQKYFKKYFPTLTFKEFHRWQTTQL